MPLYNEATGTKECSKCHTITAGGRPEVDKVYFKVKAMKDGYTTRCKDCYYQKATPDEAQARNDRVIEKKFTKMVEAQPIKEVPASKKPYSHTPQEVKRIETTSGLRFVSWEDCGDLWMPKFGKAVK